MSIFIRTVVDRVINIAAILHTSYPVSQEEAQVLYPELEKAVVHKYRVFLSFENVENSSGLFITGLLGRLYDNYYDQVDRFIKIGDLGADKEDIRVRIERTRRMALEGEVV